MCSIEVTSQMTLDFVTLTELNHHSEAQTHLVKELGIKVHIVLSQKINDVK